MTDPDTRFIGMLSTSWHVRDAAHIARESGQAELAAELLDLFKDMRSERPGYEDTLRRLWPKAAALLDGPGRDR